MMRMRMVVNEDCIAKVTCYDSNFLTMRLSFSRESRPGPPKQTSCPMRNAPVNWSEGMFLRLITFKQPTAIWQNLTAPRICLTIPMGTASMDQYLDRALAAGVLEIRGLRARWKDGSIISQGESQVDRIELAKRIDLRAPGQYTR